MINKN
jgi:hypothetical protein